MDGRGHRLGVDFGTSNTVAMLAWPDGHVRPLLFDGSPTLPSSVYADAQQGLLTGRDAVHAARISPERFEPNPKRRIDEPAVLLGEHEVATVDLIAAVLARVAGEARRVSGGALGPATITCPAAWAQTRRGVLLAAAQRAGLGAVTLVPEPVAAAQVFFSLGGAKPGGAFVVYDLGAGTFDASVVRHGGGTFEVLSAEGLATSGGLDIDAAIVGFLGAVHAGRDPRAWQRVTHPTTSTERRSHRMLWDDVRSAKEMLSRTSSTMIHVPSLESDVPLGRDQFEELARPILTATVTSTRAAIAAAGLTPAEVQGVFLVGGGSRIPLVATLLHQALGIAPTVVEQPELVVAQGAVGASASFTTPAFAHPASAPPAFAHPASAHPASAHFAPPAAAPPAAPRAAVPVAPVSPAAFSAAVPVSPVAPISAPPTASPVSTPPVSVPPAYAARTPAPPPAQAPRNRRTGVLIAAAVVVLLLLGAGAYGINKLMSGDGSTSGSGAGGSSEVQAEITRDNVDWAAKASDYDEKAGTTVAYDCPKEGFIGTVWGSGPYTTDSSVCTAAVHDGRISLQDGGRVVIRIVQGQDRYTGSLQHGINTSSYGAWPWAFEIIS
ncbi:Hsp70 family protein [Dactylosporangium sp. CA-139114]|uniref:Hsp70 family protein n=1 Tax=Dactylosporangium sp. CA-139114 TaxID=3239931 RepID=UPI003D96B3D6